MTKNLTEKWEERREQTAYQKTDLKMALNHRKDVLAHS